MRIAIVTDITGFSWGGSEEILSALAIRALESGHIVGFCAVRPHVDPAKLKPMLDAGLQLIPMGSGAKVAGFLSRRISWRLGTAVRPLLNVLKGVKDFAPDVVFHNSGDPLPSAEFVGDLESAGLLQLPYVIAVHNSFLFGSAPSPADRARFAAYFRGARLVFFTALRSQRETEHLLAAHLDRSVIVRNPINMEDLGPIPMPSGDTIRLACVGRLVTPSKGQDLMLAALGAERFKREDWALSIFGGGPDKDRLQLLAEHYGIAARVTFHGHVGDIRALWAEHHMLLLPSRHESAPLVVVEAMLCGRFAVANDVGGVGDWVVEGKTGFLSEGIDIESFESALARAFHARAEWPAIALQARARAEAMVDRDPGGTSLRLIEESLASPR